MKVARGSPLASAAALTMRSSSGDSTTRNLRPLTLPPMRLASLTQRAYAKAYQLVKGCRRRAGASLRARTFSHQCQLVVGPAPVLLSHEPAVLLQEVFYRARRIESVKPASSHNPDLHHHAVMHPRVAGGLCGLHFALLHGSALRRSTWQISC